jgi:hypothetical protein
MAATNAAKNRAIRQEALREQLASQGHAQHVTDIANKLTDLEGSLDPKNKELDALQIQRLRAAADIKKSLINKYLPDLKSTELTGEGGGDIGVDMLWTVEVVKDA